ncbi:MAG: hypothetical protein HOI21_00070 [Bacteroidetes Order II. Incertae sedis bacterium]|jgi:hypothetical protein|nr:hypothetical protein [Bacteroidetes Order II. bacterium]
MATYTGYVTMSAAFTITGDFDHLMDAEDAAEALVVLKTPQGVVWDDDMEFDVSVYED